MHLPPGILIEEGATTGARGTARAVYPKGLDLTKAAEGWRARPYNDAARFCTIGYGHLIQKLPCDGTDLPAEFQAGISKATGEALLVTDMEAAQNAVFLSVSIDLTDGQYAALVDFTFNVGAGNFRQSTLLKTVNQAQLDLIPGQFRRWILAGGKPWPGLKQRREREIELYFEGLQRPRAAVRRQDLPLIDIRAGESGGR